MPSNSNFSPLTQRMIHQITITPESFDITYTCWNDVKYKRSYWRHQKSRRLYQKLGVLVLGCECGCGYGVVAHTINEGRLRSRSHNIALAYLGGRGRRSHVVVSDNTSPEVASTDDTRAVLRIR